MERTGGKGTLVHFRCTNPAHARPTTERSDTLTVVEGLWAYCPFDIRVGDHDWQITGGVTMGELRGEGASSFRQPPEDDPRGRKEPDPQGR